MGKASLRPSDFSEGGGLLDDANVLWKELEFTTFDFNSGTEKPVLKITMEDLDSDKGDDIVQYFSCGSEEMWQPSDDGRELEYIGKPRKDGSEPNINKGTNFGILITSLIEAGYPEDQLETDCTTMQGLKCHMVRVPAPKRKNSSAFQRDDDRPQTNLIVETIIELPGGKKGAAKGKTSKPETKNTKPAATKKEENEGGDVDVNDRAVEVVMELLGENEKGLTKQKLASLVFQRVKDDKNRSQISKIVFSDEFLESGPWTYEKGVAKL